MFRLENDTKVQYCQHSLIFRHKQPIFFLNKNKALQLNLLTLAHKKLKTLLAIIHNKDHFLIKNHLKNSGKLDLIIKFKIFKSKDVRNQCQSKKVIVKIKRWLIDTWILYRRNTKWLQALNQANLISLIWHLVSIWIKLKVKKNRRNFLLFRNSKQMF